MGLRILLANDFYPPFIGGAERQTWLLGHHLAQRGDTVRVVTVWHRGLPEVETENGVAVYRLKALFTRTSRFSTGSARRLHPPFPDPEMVWRLRRQIRAFQPDVVHASGWIAYSCALALAGSRIPLLLSARDYGYTCAARTLLRNGQRCDGAAFGKCLTCATRTYGAPKGIVAVLSVFAGKRLLRRKLSSLHSVSGFVRRIMAQDLLAGSERRIPQPVIHSFLDDAAAGEPPAALPAQPFILFAGALSATKGLDVLLEAYRRLESPPPLVLIGAVWHDTPRSFPPGVTVITDQPHAQVMAAWQHCLFGVVPSVWHDPLPAVARECMASGKAVVASSSGGIPDMVIHEETGLLVPPGDAAALAQAMQRLIDDADLRARLGRSGKARAALFAAETIVPRFQALYRELTG